MTNDFTINFSLFFSFLFSSLPLSQLFTVLCKMNHIQAQQLQSYYLVEVQLINCLNNSQITQNIRTLYSWYQWGRKKMNHFLVQVSRRRRRKEVWIDLQGAIILSSISFQVFLECLSLPQISQNNPTNGYLELFSL